MTPFQREILLSFTGPEKGFQAPSVTRGAKFEDHEEWRNTWREALRDLDDEGLLDWHDGAFCGKHGKCESGSIGGSARLTPEGERVRQELGLGYTPGL